MGSRMGEKLSSKELKNNKLLKGSISLRFMRFKRSERNGYKSEENRK